ncbi:MAG: Fur family transcriptional regulator [Bacteroidales bacterium]
MITLSNEAQERLLKFGIKPSVQRIAIMDYLLANKTHPTVDEIYTSLYPFIPTLSKTTVYNTLSLFVEQGAALCLGIELKNARFDGDISSHAHFLCTDCGQIFDIFDLNAESLTHALPDHFELQDIHVYYKGCCAKCKNGNKLN